MFIFHFFLNEPQQHKFDIFLAKAHDLDPHLRHRVQKRSKQPIAAAVSVQKKCFKFYFNLSFFNRHAIHSHMNIQAATMETIEIDRPLTSDLI